MEMAIRVKSEKWILWKRRGDEPREERDMFMKSSVSCCYWGAAQETAALRDEKVCICGCSERGCDCGGRREVR